MREACSRWVTSRDVVDPVLDLPVAALVVQRVRGDQTSGQVGRGGQALGGEAGQPVAHRLLDGLHQPKIRSSICR
jgi:hypothetical protein